ncbi:MAG: outer membrane lipoprotein-sorting protein [Pseudomonadota bacterium]
MYSISLLLFSNAIAEELEAKGYEIAKRSDHSDRGFSDSVVKLNMVLRNATGKESSRTLEIQTLEAPNDDVGDKSLVIFDSPRDINGTALLSYAKIIDPDDQWLYLPALKRVKRISSTNKSGPFVGSEFAFEDFTSTELNKYSYKWLREETCEEFTCDVVERYPLYENSGYTRQIAWIDQSVYQTRRLDFYDRKDSLLKTLDFKDYREYDDGIWRSHKLSMRNHQTEKSTDLIYSDYEFKTGLNDNDFNKGVLKRAR